MIVKAILRIAYSNKKMKRERRKKERKKKGRKMKRGSDFKENFKFVSHFLMNQQFKKQWTNIPIHTDTCPEFRSTDFLLFGEASWDRFLKIIYEKF